MSNITIKTNNQWRDFVYRSDVPDSVLDDNFDWLDDDVSDGFLNYRGVWYHLQEFITPPDSAPFNKWQGWIADSYFSGVLIRFSDDHEQYQIATYFS